MSRRPVTDRPPCSTPGCARAARCRGLCRPCRSALYRKQERARIRALPPPLDVPLVMLIEDEPLPPDEQARILAVIAAERGARARWVERQREEAVRGEARRQAAERFLEVC